MPKKRKGYISLSDAVERTAKRAFNGFDDPEQAARAWLYEEFCCHWQVPVLGFRKVPKGYWAAHRREAQQTIKSGLFVPYDEGEDFRFPIEWLELRDETLFLDRAEYMARLSVLLGGHPRAVECPVFEKHEEALAGRAHEIEVKFTADASPEQVRQRISKFSQDALEMAFSDPRIAAMNRYDRYSTAPTIEAKRWVAANPPKLPSERPRPTGMMDPIGVSLTVCETCTWIAIGEPMGWWEWVGAQAELEPREIALRDRYLTLAKNELCAAIANERLTCRHATLGNVGIIPPEVFAAPGAQPSISFQDDEVRSGDYEWNRVFFRVVDLVACWPESSNTDGAQRREAGKAKKPKSSGGPKITTLERNQRAFNAVEEQRELRKYKGTIREACEKVQFYNPGEWKTWGAVKSARRHHIDTQKSEGQKGNVAE